MFKRLSLLVVVFYFFSCGNKSVKKIPVNEPNQQRIVAVWTKPDSTKQLDIMLRVISDNIKLDSVSGKKTIITDTAWGRPIYITLVDSTGKKILDKDGKEQLNPNPQYVLVPKDSVNTHVENISVDSLLSKKAKPKN